MSRFDYVKYDEVAVQRQAELKQKFEELEAAIDAIGKNEPPVGRARSTALTKLEECYMWVGKAIRDEQINRNGQAELQDERKSDGIQPYPHS